MPTTRNPLIKGVDIVKTVLTIAGSDSISGAGIQADIKTVTMNGLYATCAITAVTAQNTFQISRVYPLPPELLENQIDAVFEDIPPDAVKVGMLPNAEHIIMTANKLAYYGAKNIVLDPVLYAGVGTPLSESDSPLLLKSRLFPLCTLVTPNIPEAEILSGVKIQNEKDMTLAAKRIAEECSCAVLIKGGHSSKNADDLLYTNNKSCRFCSDRIDNKNTHGTGCTLSSAIAANLAKGFDLFEAVARAKEYVTGAITAMLDLGKGVGPMNHAFDLDSHFFAER